MNANFVNNQNIRARNFGKQFVNYYLNASIFKSLNVESELQVSSLNVLQTRIALRTTMAGLR